MPEEEVPIYQYPGLTEEQEEDAWSRLDFVKTKMADVYHVGVKKGWTLAMHKGYMHGLNVMAAMTLERKPAVVTIWVS